MNWSETYENMCELYVKGNAYDWNINKLTTEDEILITPAPHDHSEESVGDSDQQQREGPESSDSGV